MRKCLLAVALVVASVGVVLQMGSSEPTEIDVPGSGIYDMPQLCEKVRAAGIEVYVNARARDAQVYVSAGRYPPDELLRWISWAIGLEVREVGGVKFLTFPDDAAALRKEQADGAWLFARETVAMVAGRYAEDLPFDPSTYFREQPERFASLPAKQREIIWEALALRTVSEARAKQGLGAIRGRGVRVQLDRQMSARLEEMLRVSGILVRPSFDVYVHKCPLAGGHPIEIGFPVE